MRDVTREVADHFGLTEDERRELLPSGQQTLISNRVGWAKTHMKMAGPWRIRPGLVRDLAAGRPALAKKPARIDVKFLRQFPAYLEFVGKPHAPEADNGAEAQGQTPRSRSTPRTRPCGLP